MTTFHVEVYLETLRLGPIPAALAGHEEVFAFGLAHPDNDRVDRELLVVFDHATDRLRRDGVPSTAPARIEAMQQARAILEARGETFPRDESFDRDGGRRVRV